MTLRRWKSWLLATRPKTLSASVVPVVVGTALVSATGHKVKWDIFFFCLLGALFIQVGTNLINDAIDFRKGADTEDRLGPQRVTQSGLLSSRQVMLGGLACFFLALLCGIPLVLQGGWPIVIIGILSLFFGYTYTGGPFPLAYVGLGDVFVILFFGLVAVGGVYYLQTLQLGGEALVAGFQVGVLATVLIAINNLRDMNQDRIAHKKTLAVRFGDRFARFEIGVLLLLGLGLSVFWMVKGLWLAGLLPLVLVPVARKILSGVSQSEPGPIYNQYLAQASLLHMLFGFQLSLGLILPWG